MNQIIRTELTKCLCYLKEQEKKGEVTALIKRVLKREN